MKILLVIDMQKDFITGALGTKEAEEIVSKVRDKISEYKNMGNPVIFTRDTHAENYLDTEEGRNLPVVHCIEGTPGWELASELEAADSLVVNKPSFGSLKLAELIKEKYVRDGAEQPELELVGICTDICVISNAMILKASFPEAKISVDASCCAGVTPQSHANALEAMKMCHIKIIGE
jgi:nicotinamidase-related amidase